ncbi:MAG: hypothetical protein ACI8RD_009026 [Bacillariaceae sp.]|jgi:hypothetical protein
MNTTGTVSFHPEVLVHRTLHRRNCSAVEMRKTYHTMEELKQMKRSCRQLAKEDVDQAYLRGLEGRTPSGLLKKRMIRKNARQAVFLEQFRQRELGINDPVGIADAYFEITELQQVTAEIFGLHDEKEARDLDKNLPIITGDDCERRSSIVVSRKNSISRRSMKNLLAYSSKKILIWEKSMKMIEC